MLRTRHGARKRVAIFEALQFHWLFRCSFLKWEVPSGDLFSGKDFTNGGLLEKKRSDYGWGKVTGQGQKKCIPAGSKFVRELQKLGCSVIYKIDSAIGRRGGKNNWESARVGQWSYVSFLGMLEGSMRGISMESLIPWFAYTWLTLFVLKKQRFSGCQPLWWGAWVWIDVWNGGEVEASGQSREILVFWDNWVLEVIEMEKGAFSASYWFRKFEDNFIWMFIGFIVLFWLKRGKAFGMNWVILEVFGTILGVWDGTSMF